MTAITFDTLAYTKKLIAAGVPQQQAEAQAETMAEIIDEKIATKKDLAELEERLNHKLEELNYKLEELNYKLTIRLGSMLIAAISVLAILIKIL